MRYLALLIFIFTLLNCDTTDLNNDSSLELDRVWQYLRTYSVFTERLPERNIAQTFSSPQELAKSIKDTIRYLNTDTLFYFTYYRSNWEHVRDGYFPIDTASRNFRYYDTTVYTKKLTDDILYLNIPRFTSTAYSEMLVKSNAAINCDNIILDLRWNPGGYVDVCTLIVNLFLPENTHYMNTLYRSNNVSIEGSIKADTAMWYSSSRETDNWRNKNIAILMNEYSASASEILIEALKSDSVNSTLLGQKTFGKGIGQVHLYFQATSNGGLSVTTLKFLGTNNISYHNIGIIPDIVIDGDSMVTDNNQVIAAAQNLDATFNSVNYVSELQDIENAVIARHFPYRTKTRDTFKQNFRPMAIVDEIFVD